MTKNKLVVTAVEYLNTAVFIDGLQNSRAFQNEFELVLDNPAGCSRRMVEGSADIGLVPVASISEIQPKFIFDDFCIGADQPVRTVKLLSNCSVGELKRIVVDSHSRTSVRLLQVLCKDYWNIQVTFEEKSINDLNLPLPADTGMLAIGDKVFIVENEFEFSFDLAEEWMKLTSTDFVFAVWLSKIELDEQLINTVKTALQESIDQKDSTIKKWSKYEKYKSVDVEEYLNHNISYPFNQNKKKGLELFRNMSEGDFKLVEFK